jgi:hypothetical protein
MQIVTRNRKTYAEVSGQKAVGPYWPPFRRGRPQPDIFLCNLFKTPSNTKGE